MNPSIAELENSLTRVAELTMRHGGQRFNLFTKEFVDALSHPRNASPERQLEMIAGEPMWLQEPWMDALLAGMAEFIANREDLNPPAWTEDAHRFLAEPRFWGYRPETRALMLAETPGPFRRRNLFCGYIWLHSDRWESGHA